MIIGERLAEFGRLAEDLNLPTTPKIAKESRDEFLILAHLIPLAFREELDAEAFHEAVYGFDSIRTIYLQSGPSHLERAFNHPSSQFRLLREKKSLSYASFINLRSAQRIISLNKDIFPEARDNPVSWIMEKGNYLSSQQIGLLSGFPRASVLDFKIWSKVINNRKKDAYNGPKLFHDQWLFDSGEISDEQFAERVKNGLAERLTAREKAKVISASKISSGNNIKYGAILFSEEDARIRTIGLEFMCYLQSHPDFTLEKVLGSNGSANGRIPESNLKHL